MPCPAGAVCDSFEVRGKVQGSEWETDRDLGIYRLLSCPQGFQVQNEDLNGFNAEGGAAVRGVRCGIGVHCTEMYDMRALSSRALQVVCGNGGVRAVPDQHVPSERRSTGADFLYSMPAQGIHA